MQFEEFDKKIKEAAENHHPAYDEQAWAKMNKLLDKHLPEKDERRRRFAWLFFLLFLVGGAGIFYGVQSLISTRSEVVTANKPVPATVKENAMNPAEEQVNMQEKAMTNPDKEVATPSGPADAQAGTTKTGITLPVAGEVKPLTPSGRNQVSGISQVQRTGVTKARPASNGWNNNPDIAPVFQSGIAKKKKKQPVNATTDRAVTGVTSDKRAEPVTTQDPAPVVPDPIVVVNDDKKADQPAVIVAPLITTADPKKDSLALADMPAAVAPSVKKKSPKKQSHFFVTLSAGPDASFASNGKPGKIIPVTGAGIGYIYRERFSIRTGFYNAAKIYTALPDAYNAPPNFYNYYPFLVKVDANCRVYEIPVSLGYHFGARKNHSWFASATLSSYLMKRETYNYSYKTSAWGSVQQREWNLYNQNQHLFSVLGISGGYQRKITERISFIAEPYLRLPFQGVGYGKVKLNSAGVLFSLAVQPAALVPRKQKK
jgi:hypothetical protein